MFYIRNKYIVFFWLLAICLYPMQSIPQTTGLSEMARGARFIPTKTYSDDANEKILKLFEGLRVADVSDGMDYAGLPDIGLIDPIIRPLWKDLENFSHRICGIALTVRYVASQKPMHPPDTANYNQWESNWYNQFSSEPFAALIKNGQVIVIDDVEESDIGSIGSNNILGWKKRGAVGVITDASARDTDEIEKERVPLYFRRTGRGIRPGRNELESVNCPVCIGGVLICPGDVVVADGDGIVVVPRDLAEDVAKYARTILENDKAGRRKLYESMGIKKDRTVE